MNLSAYFLFRFAEIFSTLIKQVLYHQTSGYLQVQNNQENHIKKGAYFSYLYQTLPCHVTINSLI